MTVPFSATLADGRRISGDVSVPGEVPKGPYRDAAIADLQTKVDKALRDRNQSGAAVRRRIMALIPVLAAQLAPALPPAAPSRVEIERDSEGRVVRHVAIPATPPPNILAREIARRLAPIVAAEQILAEQADSDRSRQLELARDIQRRLTAVAEQRQARLRRAPPVTTRPTPTEGAQ